MAWTAYRMHVADVALDLFLIALPSYAEDAKQRSIMSRIGRETLRDPEVQRALARYPGGARRPRRS